MTEQEFKSFTETTRKDLISLARRFTIATGGPEEADDIVQEAFLALWELNGNGYPVRDTKALAIKITKNICISRYRKRKIRQVIISDDKQEGNDPADKLVENEDIRKIKDSLYDGLTRTQRELMTLRNDQGLSLDEITAATGRPKSSVKVSLSNARKRLSEQIKKWL